MTNTWISLKDIPAEGREFSFAGQEALDAWAGFFREFKLDARVEKPLEARFTVLTPQGGVLVRGSLSGSVVLQCSRCAGEVEYPVDVDFEIFEDLPAGEAKPGTKPTGAAETEAGEVDEQCGFLRVERGEPELSPAEMLWEEFSLHLPAKLVCAEACRGLCPDCGANLNDGPCGCGEQGGDPRMAALRGLKIKQ